MNLVADDPVGLAEVPLVCFDADIVRILSISLRTLKRLRATGAFPIPELARLDRRHRYSRQDVLHFLSRENKRGLTRRIA